MQTPNSKLRAILLISASFLSGACSSFYLARGSDEVRIYAFQRDKGQLYYGRRDQPLETIQWSDPKVDDLVCLYRSDWTAVKNRLVTAQ